MYTKRLQEAVNKYANKRGHISRSKIEFIFREVMGYPFNRHSIMDLLKEYVSSDGRKISMVSQAEYTEGKRDMFGYRTVVDILVYLLLSESIKGMIRGNVIEERINKLAISRLVAFLGNIDLRTIVYNADVRQGNVDGTLGFTVPDDYDAGLHRKKPLSLEDRCSIAYFFLYHWINGHNPEDFNFYADWRIMRERIICEDPIAVETKEKCDDGETVKMAPFKDGTKFRMEFLNRYKIRHAWESKELIPISSMLNSNKGASLASSITILDSFIKTGNMDEVGKLRDWMEVILTYENGSGWVTAEARTALEQDVPMLDQDSLIDNWWLLSYIYLQTIQG